MGSVCKITILLIIVNFMRFSQTQDRRHIHTCRSYQTLTNETRAILPGMVLCYQSGELSSVPSQYVDITRTDIEVVNIGANQYLSQRSSCPWRFVKNFDENRIPNTLYEAKCRMTATCLNSRIYGCSEQACEEVKQFTLVKRKTGPNTYEKILEPISVGCTCACSHVPRMHSTSK